AGPRHEIADDREDLRFGGLRALLHEVFVVLPDKGDHFLPRRHIADHRDERPENLLEPRLEIACARADFRPRVLEVPQAIEQELVAYPSGLLVEALVEIERDLAPYLAAAHVLRDAAAF